MFQFFPKILYLINDFDYQKVVDLNVSAQITEFVKKFKTSPSARQFIVRDGERPEALSQRLYGTPRYDYLLMLLNDVESKNKKGCVCVPTRVLLCWCMRGCKCVRVS